MLAYLTQDRAMTRLALSLLLLLALTGVAAASPIMGFADKSGFAVRLGDEQPPQGAVLCDVDVSAAAGLRKTYFLKRDLKLGNKALAGCLIKLDYEQSLIDIKVLIPEGQWKLDEACKYFKQAYPGCVASVEEVPYQGRVLTLVEGVKGKNGKLRADTESAKAVYVHQLDEPGERYIVVLVTSGPND